MSRRENILYIRTAESQIFIQQLKKHAKQTDLATILGEKPVEKLPLEAGSFQHFLKTYSTLEFCFAGYPAFFILAKFILKQRSLEEGFDYIWRITSVSEDIKREELKRLSERLNVLVSNLEQDSVLCMDDIKQVFECLVEKNLSEKNRFTTAFRMLSYLHTRLRDLLEDAIPEAGYNKIMVEAVLCSTSWYVCRASILDCFEESDLSKLRKSVGSHIFKDMQDILREALKQMPPKKL